MDYLLMMGADMESSTYAPLRNNTIDLEMLVDNQEFLLLLKISQYLLLYVAPIIIIVGTVGNVLCFCVLYTPYFRKTACGFLLKILALADIGCLNCGLLRMWITELPFQRLDVRSLSKAGCKIHAYLTMLFPQLSAWTLTLVTIDRAVSIAFPINSRVVWTKSRVLCIWFAIFFCLVALNSYNLIIQDVKPYVIRDMNKVNITKNVCVPQYNQLVVMKAILPWMEFIVMDAIPSIVIVFCNVIIIYHLVQSARHRKVAAVGQGRDKQLQSTTAMLITISVFFLLTVTPRCVFLFFMVAAENETPSQKGRLNLFYTCVHLTYALNNACNFLLYCGSGSKFRLAAYNLFTCRKMPSDPGSHSGSTTNLRTRVQVKH
jgi:hypothetical protein